MSFLSHKESMRSARAGRDDVRPASRPRTRAASDGSRAVRIATLVLIGAALVLAVVGQARAAGSAVPLESPRIDQGNIKSLQRGARHFVNNCMGCHSASYNRYSRVAQDLGLDEADVENNFIFTTDADGEPTKVGALMENNMTKDYGQQAFGVMPPNLSLTARSRGTDWIYSFLKTFYLDPDRAGTGVNNLVYPGTAMPHVLWKYQGYQALEAHAEGEGDHGAPELTLVEPGALSPDEYDDMIADITNFMGYMADPIKTTRHSIGIIVMLFLFGLLAVAYFLKKEYWKDVV